MTTKHSKKIQKLKAISTVLALIPAVGLTQDKTLVDTVTSTGTHLTSEQTPVNQASTIYTREEILRSGESNTADFIRKLPSNSFGSLRPQSGSSAQSDAAVSLRGLGAGKTLVLIDGRRMPKSPQGASWQNLNLIPLGAIDRIEVLTEGASALYGADAVAGVINVITRTDFQGVEIMLGTADVSIPKSGGEREEGSVVFGTKSERSSLLAGVSWNDRELVYQRDVPWRNPSYSFFGNNFTTVTDGVENSDFTSYNSGCESLGPGFLITTNSASLNGLNCDYDASSQAAEDASIENNSLYAKGTYQINDNWSLWTNTSFTQSESFGSTAPVPSVSDLSTPLSTNSPNNPSNPNSPLYDASLNLEPTEVHWYHRFAALGNRNHTVSNQLTNLSVGATGHMGQTKINVGYRNTNNRSSDVGRNYLLYSAAVTYIETGLYDLSNPFNTPEQVLNAMRATLFRDAKYDQNELFGNLSFDWIELNGGTAAVVIGVENIQEKYSDQYDSLSEAGQISGTHNVGSASGTRDTNAVYFETQLPVLDQLNINLAARYDDYSDINSELSTKITAQWHPLEKLTIRGAFSQDHYSPDLQTLNQVPIPDSGNISLPGYPSTTDFYIANSQLQSEQIDQFNLDVNYQITDWLSLNLGYWDLSLNDRIKFFNGFALANRLDNGQSVPAGLDCTLNEDGTYYESCLVGYGNGGKLEQSGMTFKAQTQLEFGGGVLNSQIHIIHQLDLELDNSISQLNFAGTPDTRALMTHSYSKQNWNIAYNLNFIGKQNAENEYQAVGSWTTHDLQASYQTSWNGTFALGVMNLGEKSPPVNLINPYQPTYNFNLYDGNGRIVYARYTQIF